MSWLNWIDPWSGAILAACVLPPLILLYFLKLRRRTQPIACTLLWKKSVEDLRANAPFQRLRKSLLLLLQLIALIMLALALMQPQLKAGGKRGGRVVIMIDNSASMNAIDTEDKRSRLTIAKEEAKKLVELLDSGGLFGGGSDEVMVIAFNESASVLSNFTSVRSQLINAIDSIPPTDRKSSIDEALKLARAHTTITNPDDPNVEIITGQAAFEIFTDGQIPDFAEQANRGEALTYHAVGTESPDNVSFSSVAVERPFDRPGEVQVFAGLLNFNSNDVVCTVQMSVDGNVLDGNWIRDVEIAGASIDPSTGQLVPGRSNVIFGPFPQVRDSVIEVANLRDDALASDNRAVLVTPPTKNYRVAVVGARSFLLDVALDGMRLRDVEQLSAAQFAERAKDGPLEEYDVIILEDVEAEALPPGRYLAFATPLPLEGFDLISEGDGMFIPAADQDHPVMRYVSLDNLVIGKYRRLAESDRFRILADGSVGREIIPAIVEFERPGVNVVWLAFNHFDTNWFTNQSFVIFLYNAIDYLGTVGEAFAQQDLAPGQPITTRLSSTAQNLTMRLPNGTAENIQGADPTSLAWSRTALAGLYTLSWREGEQQMQRQFAINQFSEQESDLRRSDLKWGGEIVAASGENGGVQTPLWPWALGFCLAVLMFEWWVYHRKTFI